MPTNMALPHLQTNRVLTFSPTSFYAQSARRAQLSKLQNNFQSALMSFQNAQQAAAGKSRDFVARARAASRDASAYVFVSFLESICGMLCEMALADLDAGCAFFFFYDANGFSNGQGYRG
jgi:hypothetical protein